MNDEVFDRLCELSERNNRGWIVAGDVPPCRVIADGEEVRRARRVNLRKAKVEVINHPVRLDKYRKRFLTKMCHYDRVELIPK